MTTSDQTINMSSWVNAFRWKMQHFYSKRQRRDLVNFRNVMSELEMQGKPCDSARHTDHFQDSAVLELVATFMCYPFQEDAEAAFSATLFQLFWVDEESLTWQADTEPESRAVGQLWSLFTGKVPHRQEMCCLLDCFLGRHVFKIFHHDWGSFGSMLEAGCQQLCRFCS